MTSQPLNQDLNQPLDRESSSSVGDPVVQDAVLDDFLVEAFRTFLARVLTFVEPLREGPRSTRNSQGLDLKPSAIRADLKASLTDLENEVVKLRRDPTSPIFAQARYLTASAADGQLTQFDWIGRRAWQASPLRNDFPPPDGVSKNILKQAETLLQQAEPDTALVEILLMVLALPLPKTIFAESEAPQPGDESERETSSKEDDASDCGDPGQSDPGQSAVPDSRKTTELIRKLSNFLPQGSTDAAPLFPDAYRRRRRPGPTLYLPAVRKWWISSLALLLVLALLSRPIWRHASAAARNTVDQILAVPSGSAP